MTRGWWMQTLPRPSAIAIRPPQRVRSAAPPCRGHELLQLIRDVLDLSLIGPATLQTSGITWIWEVERSTEALYLGPEVKVTVPGLSKGTKVKLTGITKQGCVISATQTVGALR